MSYSQQQQRQPDLEDGLAKWYKSVGKDGTERYFTRMREDHFNDPNFKAKCVDACNGNLQSPEKQEGFTYKDETYSLSQMDNGAVTIWQGEARFPLKKKVTLPEKWGQQNFKSGGYNKGGGGNYNKKPYTPPKIVVQNAIKNPKYFNTLDDAFDDCKQEGRLFYSGASQNDSEGNLLYVTGEVAIVE